MELHEGTLGNIEHLMQGIIAINDQQNAATRKPLF
jgi:hypothetical protein